MGHGCSAVKVSTEPRFIAVLPSALRRSINRMIAYSWEKGGGGGGGEKEKGARFCQSVAGTEPVSGDRVSRSVLAGSACIFYLIH